MQSFHRTERDFGNRPAAGASNKLEGPNMRFRLLALTVLGSVLLSSSALAQFGKKKDQDTNVRTVQGVVSEVAALAVYLCGDAAQGITGTEMKIDGGWTAGKTPRT